MHFKRLSVGILNRAAVTAHDGGLPLPDTAARNSQKNTKKRNMSKARIARRLAKNVEG